MDDNIWLTHLYNAITKNVDLAPGQVYNTEGSISIGNSLRVHVYSDDHGTHFHVRYQNGEIDARFSFPNVSLETHVSQKEFSTRQVKNIVSTLNGNPSFTKYIKSELAKAGRLL